MMPMLVLVLDMAVIVGMLVPAMVAAVQVYPHETCATDTENVQYVFNVVKDIILQDNMRGAGIL